MFPPSIIPSPRFGRMGIGVDMIKLLLAILAMGVASPVSELDVWSADSVVASGNEGLSNLNPGFSASGVAIPFSCSRRSILRKTLFFAALLSSGVNSCFDGGLLRPESGLRP